MPSGDTTNIEVKVPTWRYLNSKKQPGDSFDDVLQRELGIGEGGMDESDESTSEADSTSSERRVQLPDDMPQAVDEADAGAAIDAVLRFIADEPAEFSMIAKQVGREHDLGYDVDQVELRDGAWWSRVVKPGIKANGAEHQPGRGWSAD